MAHPVNAQCKRGVCALGAIRRPRPRALCKKPNYRWDGGPAQFFDPAQSSAAPRALPSSPFPSPSSLLSPHSSPFPSLLSTLSSPFPSLLTVPHTPPFLTSLSSPLTPRICVRRKPVLLFARFRYLMQWPAPKRTPLQSTRSGLVIVSFYHWSGPFRAQYNRTDGPAPTTFFPAGGTHSRWPTHAKE